MAGSTPVDVRAARTFLFVPGHRPERFAKATAAGADAVLLDLEDAVAESAKDDARAHVEEWLRNGGAGAVRINAVGTPWHSADLAMVALLGCPVVVPKADDPAALDAVRVRLRPGVELIPLIETARGVAQAADVCAVPGVARPAFGSVDLATELGIAPDDQLALTTARSLVVLGAATAGVAAPIDGVTTALDDESVLVDDVRHGLRLGLTGKLCIHPRQIQPVHTTLAPSPDEVAWARRVIEASTDGAAVAVDGQMVDRPVVERARRLLSRAG
jgi:citrate lyase subunit beta / citryl-CoA lyase